MSIFRPALLLFVLFATSASYGKSPPFPVHQWKLSNGLAVIVVPQHKAPLVAVQIFYHAGSKDEPADKRGIAHMFEHMMFKGSVHVEPELHAQFVASMGGSSNAFTVDDLTAYHQTIPPAALDFTLALEAERMRNLLLTQKTINSEREVVKEELRLRVENNPIMQAFDKVLHLAYRVHPYQQFPVGEKRMLDTVTVDDCRKFYDRYYQPNNATLIVVGDVNENEVKQLVNKHFGTLPAGPEPERPSKKLIEPEQVEARHTTLQIPVQLPISISAFHIARGDSADIKVLEVVQQILSGGESSRLYQRLVRKEKAAVSAGGRVLDKEDPGVFLTFAVFLPNESPERVEALMQDEILRVITEPVQPKELEKAKNQLAAQAVYQQERVNDIATQIGSDAIIAHDPLNAFAAAEKYDAVTAADIMRVAKAYFLSSKESRVTLKPVATAGAH